jgi:hypothetical protein
MTARPVISSETAESDHPTGSPMMSPPPHLRRRDLIITAGATTAMYLTGAMFAVRQATGDAGIWAPISDAAVLAFAASLLPVVTGSAHDLRAAGAHSAPRARAIGLTAATLLTAGSTFLLATDLGLVDLGRPLADAGLAVQFLGLAGVGVWLAHTGALTIRRGLWSRVAGWSAVVAGVGYLAGTVVAALQLFGHPLFLIAYATTVGGFATWLAAMIRRTR